MLSQDQKNTYKIPVLYKENGIGKFEKDTLIQEYTSRDQVVKSSGINAKTLNKRIKNNEEYDGFIYKFIEPKLYI
jgi:hypothetical protein